MKITHQGVRKSIRAALDALGLSNPNRAAIRVTTHNLPPGGDLAAAIRVLEENEIDYDTLRRFRWGGRKRSGAQPKALYEHVTATWTRDETVTNQEVADACELALIAARLKGHEVLAITRGLPDGGARADILISRMKANGRIQRREQTAYFDERCRRLVAQEKHPALTAAHQWALEQKAPPGLLDLLKEVPIKLKWRRRGGGGRRRNEGASPPPRPPGRGR